MVSILYQDVCAELFGDQACAPAHHIATTSPPTSFLWFSLYISSHTVKQKGEKPPSVITVEGICEENERIVYFALSPWRIQIAMHISPQWMKTYVWIPFYFFFLWNFIFYGRGNRFTLTTHTWISFTLGSKQISCAQILGASSYLLWFSQLFL